MTSNNINKTKDSRQKRIKPVILSVGDASLTVEPSTLPRVALVRGPIVSTSAAINNEATPSIGMAYISGYLKHKGYSVVIVDGTARGLGRIWPLTSRPGYHCQGLTIEEIVAAIPDDTDVIGLSIMFSGEWPVQRELINKIRLKFPDALIVAGGEHITSLSEFSLRACPALDICVRGEGEHSLFEVLEAHRNKTGFSKIPGISFIDEKGEYQEITGIPRIADIDHIPWPDWPDGYLEGFWQVGKSYGVQSARDMPLNVSRGCPFECTFCSNPAMWTTRYILRDVDDVIAEMKHYLEKYNITAFQFYDLTAIIKREWTIELCQKMIENGINVKWSLPSGTRSEALDAEVLSLLKKTNCSYLVYAPESGSPRTLKAIKKKIVLQRLTDSVLTAKKLKLTIRTNLIIGFPHETRSDVARTVMYGLYLAFKGVDEPSINIFSPYPGSEIYNDLMEAGHLELNDDYFFALTSLNSDFTKINPLTFNPRMGPRELAIYRLVFIMLNYFIGYICYPKRILRFIRNVYMGRNETATVFEHRMKDLLGRKKVKS